MYRARPAKPIWKRQNAFSRHEQLKNVKTTFSAANTYDYVVDLGGMIECTHMYPEV